MGRFEHPEAPGAAGAADLRIEALERRVARLEAQVARLQGADEAPAEPTYRLLEQPPVPEWMAEALDLKARGKVVEAIKVYREGTGVGLQEAADAVEAL